MILNLKASIDNDACILCNYIMLSLTVPSRFCRWHQDTATQLLRQFMIISSTSCSKTYGMYRIGLHHGFCEKCKVMHIGNTPHFDYNVTVSGNSTSLSDVTFEKDLGVWTTDKLESGLHCQKAEASANWILGMIRKAFYRMSGDLFMLYINSAFSCGALIQSRISISSRRCTFVPLNLSKDLWSSWKVWNLHIHVSVMYCRTFLSMLMTILRRIHIRNA